MNFWSRLDVTQFKVELRLILYVIASYHVIDRIKILKFGTQINCYLENT
jgi:hypothetical protein